MFEIEIRKTCKICGKKLGYKMRTYCSPECRNHRNYLKYREKNRLWQLRRNDKIASVPSDKKVKCLICGKYYVQVGSHIIQRHKISARRYREIMDLEVKRGITPDWYRKKKGDKAIENGTYKNLKIGKKFWFIKGGKNVGKYQRSSVTLERLRNLHKLTKRYENN